MAETTDNGMAAAMMALAASNNGFNHHRGDYGDRSNGDWDGYRTEQNQANMSLMAAIGGVDKSVAVSAAAMEASQAVQSAGIVSQLNNVAGSLAGRIDGLKDVVNASAMMLTNRISDVDRSVMESRYEVSKDITADGDKTRDLITRNYQDTLNRQLAEANAALIKARSEDRAYRRSRDNEINVTQTVTQAQQQQQTQAHFDRLYHMLADATQSIRATNQAINFGSGTLTSTPTNTSTNNRA